AVDGRGLRVPALTDGVHRLGGNTQLGETVFVDDVLAGFETDPLQFRGGRFQPIDLVGAEAVIRAFVPIWLVARIAVTQPPTQPLGGRVAAGLDRQAFHAPLSCRALRGMLQRVIPRPSGPQQSIRTRLARSHGSRCRARGRYTTLQPAPGAR